MQVEVVGSFESGILAASWSPDDSVLVLVTGEGALMPMTSLSNTGTVSSRWKADFNDLDI